MIIIKYNASHIHQQLCLRNHLHTRQKPNTRIGWTSSNWSGYAITGKQGAYHRISGRWRVPCVKPSPKAAFSSSWIGIDGFGNDALIQTGTGHTFQNGKAQYYAWWEILPASETVIPLPVTPGDIMQASIIKVSRTHWCITLCNLTREWTFRTRQRYNGPQSSAEWIVEAPLVGGVTSTLARLSSIPFTRCRINGRRPGLTPSEAGVLVQNKIPVAVPSCPNPCGDAFTVRVMPGTKKKRVQSRHNALLIPSKPISK